MFPFRFVLILSLSMYGLVNCSDFWSIENQMQVEDRPYTMTPKDPSTTGPTYRSTYDKVLIPKFREMHRYCDGQCFYAPDTCAVNNNYASCDVAASVAQHNKDLNGELYCDLFGPDNLRQSFCSKSEAQLAQQASGPPDLFYTITLHRKLDYVMLSCKNKWNEATGRRCRPTEFVGISFLSDNAANPDILELEDLWYICIVGESHLNRVTMWTNVDGTTSTPQQIIGTSPHLESGAGVIFSKILFDPDTLSMGCQFVLQVSNMSLHNPPNHAAFFNDTSKRVRVKIATGIVKRSFDDDTVEHPFHDPLAGIPSWFVFGGTMIKPTDEIFFNSLEVRVSHPVPNIQAEMDLEDQHSEEFTKIISKCDKPGRYPNLYIACYPPNEQKNCVHTGRCAAMFIVEVPRSDKSFNTITAYIYSLIPDYKSLRKVKRPTGFASVAFSQDDAMGRDVVITCHADGRSAIGVYVSINFEKNNVYPGLVDYNNLIFDRESYGTVYNSRILCKWKMNTQFVVNMFDYEPDYRKIIFPGQSEKLEFDFKTKPVYLLLAAGNRNYPNGKIVHHDFRQILQAKFSKENFFKDAKGNKSTPNIFVIVLPVIILLLGIQ